MSWDLMQEGRWWGGKTPRRRYYFFSSHLFPYPQGWEHSVRCQKTQVQFFLCSSTRSHCFPKRTELCGEERERPLLTVQYCFAKIILNEGIVNQLSYLPSAHPHWDSHLVLAAASVCPVEGMAPTQVMEHLLLQNSDSCILFSDIMPAQTPWGPTRLEQL